MSIGWDTNAILALIGTVIALWAFLPGWKDYQEWLKTDPTYRAKTAAALCDKRWAERYRSWLSSSLDWLERRFGERNSARALGVCTVISLCYAWAAFFLGYAMGLPGRLGEIVLLPEELGGKKRWALFAFAVILPLVTFFIGRWLGGLADRTERRLKARLLKRRRLRIASLNRRGFVRFYCLISALAALAIALLLQTLASFTGVASIAVIVGMGMLIAAGPVFGLAAARRVNSSWLMGPTATLAGALLGVVALAEALSLAFALAIALAIARAGAGAVVVAVVVVVVVVVAGAGAVVALVLNMPTALAGAAALAGAVVFAGAGALAIVVSVALAIALAFAFAFALGVPGATSVVVVVVVAGAVGAATAARLCNHDRRGAFAGGVGLLLVAALFSPAYFGRVDDAFSILIITFFLLLPLANGLWDWLSWRVSRWLGRDLLDQLDQGGGVRTIAWHALADFALASLFLTTLAFALAFGVEGYNQFADARAGKEVYDLAAFVEEAAREPWSKGFWLTAMLISTLGPTFLHFALLLASPLVMLVQASPKRAALAAALEGYQAAEKTDAILQHVGWHLARTQYLAWAGATLLTVLLLAIFAAFVGLLHQGGIADYIAKIAIFAIDAARWCF